MNLKRTNWRLQPVQCHWVKNAESTLDDCCHFVQRYSDVIKNTMSSQITGVSIVCSSVCSGVGQRKHQSSTSLAFVRGNHRWPVDSPNKGPVTRKVFPFDDVIMGYSPHNKCNTAQTRYWIRVDSQYEFTAVFSWCIWHPVLLGHALWRVTYTRKHTRMAKIWFVTKY